MRRRILASAIIKLKLRMDACRVLSQVPCLTAYAVLHHNRTLDRYRRVLERLRP